MFLIYYFRDSSERMAVISEKICKILTEEAVHLVKKKYIFDTFCRTNY